ncbi:WbqC-like protein [Desulfitobacterium hafniense]|uniref:WbqC-like protein n=1 Tax=Desulfitobacterium hafniense TaxID=49338 RepID=A0A098B2R1_DESHA|nr:WbqC family protein [Desulfitobacterium hafniense]CDX03133.1 WbqC-like protein [Desulfitobacterium hafniense]
MKCAIMQPTYLPWAGYFNLISLVDYFVFLDDVQFERRSWQSRNRIPINDIPTWVTVPVKQSSQKQIIKEVLIDDEQRWREKHLKTFQHIYAKHPFLKEIEPILDPLRDTSIKYLADLNILIIEYIAQKLKLCPRFIRASDLSIGEKRSDHLLSICKKLECNEYLSPLGSADYLIQDGSFDSSGVLLMFQNYTPSVYPQQGVVDYVTHLSIIDVIANIGWERTALYIKGLGEGI